MAAPFVVSDEMYVHVCMQLNNYTFSCIDYIKHIYTMHPYASMHAN